MKAVNRIVKNMGNEVSLSGFKFQNIKGETLISHYTNFAMCLIFILFKPYMRHLGNR